MFAVASDSLARQGAALADTMHSAAQAGGESGSSIFGEILHHVQDSRHLELPGLDIELPQFPPLHIGGITIDLSITKHVVFLWLAALILGVVAVVAARKNLKRSVPTGLGNMIEVLLVFIRDEIALPNMGPGGLRYIPYLLTTFFFILIMNLLGLLPYGASATANISVTGGLAVLAFVMIQISAIRAQGLGGYFHHLTGGVHWALWPIMVPIEILGLFTKSFALCMRLFANMSAGHIVIFSFLGLIFLFKSYFIAPASVGFALGVALLELFVAFLQAYIFTMLTALFMGLGMQAGHEERAHDH